MKIIQCDDVYSVDSISMEDIIYGKAMLNKTTTVGTIVSIRAIFNSSPVSQPLELDKFNQMFQNAESIQTSEDLANFLEDIKDDLIYPLERLDDFLTYYVNRYLAINMKLKCSIDSIFTDLRELLEDKNVQKSPSLNRMLNFFTRLFINNYNNRDVLKEILTQEQEHDTKLDRLIYPIPVLIVNPVCALYGFGKENGKDTSLGSFKLFLNSNELSKIVCQNDSFYPILEEIRASSKDFDELGYMTIYHKSLDEMKYGIVSNNVFYRDDETYFLTK